MGLNNFLKLRICLLVHSDVEAYLLVLLIEILVFRLSQNFICMMT
jgi:hypothetical protein